MILYLAVGLIFVLAITLAFILGTIAAAWAAHFEETKTADTDAGKSGTSPEFCAICTNPGCGYTALCVSQVYNHQATYPHAAWRFK
jgi:hypothetical protein